MKKKNVVIFIVIILIMFLVVFTQYLNPLIMKDIKISKEELEIEVLECREEMYINGSLDEAEDKLNYIDGLPSNNSEDYMYVYFAIDY